MSPGSWCTPHSAWRNYTEIIAVSSFLAGGLKEAITSEQAPVKSLMVGLFFLLLCPALHPPLASWPSSDCRRAEGKGWVLVLSTGKEAYFGWYLLV